MGSSPFAAGLVATASPEWLLFWLLVAGHLLGDFLFQTDWMVANKRRGAGVRAHVAAVLVIHLVVIAPFLSLPVGVVVVGVGVVHGLIDVAKSRYRWRRPGPLVLFLADQALHLLVLFGAYQLILLWDPVTMHASLPVVRSWAVVAVVLGGFAFNATGGSAIVRGTLRALSPALEEEDRGGVDEEGVPGSGHRIGTLERTLTVVLVLVGQWGAVGLLLAAKSIARFEALKKRHFAEYYLTGTLTSLLVAVLVGLALRALVLGTAGA